jgi:hypothetical protein
MWLVTLTSTFHTISVFCPVAKCAGNNGIAGNVRARLAPGEVNIGELIKILDEWQLFAIYALDPPGRKEGEEERKRNNEERRNDEKGIGTQ